MGLGRRGVHPRRLARRPPTSAGALAAGRRARGDRGGAAIPLLVLTAVVWASAVLRDIGGFELGRRRVAHGCCAAATGSGSPTSDWSTSSASSSSAGT
jgi:hypothetical protein